MRDTGAGPWEFGFVLHRFRGKTWTLKSIGHNRAVQAIAAMPAPPVKPPRKVWRISKEAPLGEWVMPNAPIAPPRVDLPEVSYGNWVTSSFDLASGAEIVEVTDTIPGDLFDELFDESAMARKRSGS